jgi:cob(I)alamin adenosyltransferase
VLAAYVTLIWWYRLTPQSHNRSVLYTRKGDNGTSGLFGTKERFPKNSPVYEALGAVDEFNSLLGLCRARSNKIKSGFDVAREILKVQECLFIIQAELAGAEKSIAQIHIDNLESSIEQIEKRIKNPHAFVISGTTELSALYDYARAVARRAERSVINAQQARNMRPPTLAYLNRLSSFLYVLARYSATEAEAKELSPSYQK